MDYGIMLAYNNLQNVNNLQTEITGSETQIAHHIQCKIVESAQQIQMMAKGIIWTKQILR